MFAATANQPDWAQLQQRMKGTLVLPSDAIYATAKQISWKEFDGMQPAAVAYCESVLDVRACLKFAQANGIAATARSGGHSFMGFSLTSGLVIDVSRLNSVRTVGTTAIVGGGALQIDILSRLAGTGLALPGGLFPTVGSGGFVQGGGLGWQTRFLGMASDTLESAVVVLADGSVVVASENWNSDLYWALRGGGGGNFGIVTSYRMQATAVPTISRFNLAWSWEQAADVLTAWQQWAIASPRRLSSGPVIALFDAAAGNVPTVAVAGVWMGDPAELPPLLDSLVSESGHQPATRVVSDDTYTDGMLAWYNCGNRTVPQCHLEGTTDEGQIPRFGWSFDRSRLFSQAIPATGVDALLAAFDANRVAGHSRFIRAIVLGGQANDFSRTETAYVHRDSEFIMSIATGLPTGTPSSSDMAAAQSWSSNVFDVVNPYSNGESYVNYLDRVLPDWADAYYKENLSRLRIVKNHYDPENFFSFSQSIA
ncbi:FAD-binding oxidoreductase [Solwaraspora sp. WMMD406]|uniref:FAD-binding oxidoreductase n=1 Tax=Solwaraspora sp. WMMD406 TaxID=3016095 RepID=UPI00241620D6|nr:FAD-binding oxidoreductase [Solwaraspora sp. WMMD406]MDG4763510.1 FAD-binding oxidoreductase [Solwaraspora sp. WMMD406]